MKLRMQRYLLLYNPKSGQAERAGLQEFIQRVRSFGHFLDEINIHSAPLNTLLANAEQYDAVIAAGGDGTVGSVAAELRYRKVPLLPYPAGTANLIAQNLNLPSQPELLAHILLKGHVLDIDMVAMRIDGHEVYYSLIAGAGLDAQIIQDSLPLKSSWGAGAYWIAAFGRLHTPVVPVTLTLDGRTVRTKGISIMVANFGMTNFRLPYTKGISPLDGLLTVLVYKGTTPLGLLPVLLDAIMVRLGLGEPIFEDALEVHHAREVTVETGRPLPVQHDGEPWEGFTPFSAKILPSAIQMICDAQPKDVRT